MNEYRWRDAKGSEFKANNLGLWRQSNGWHLLADSQAYGHEMLRLAEENRKLRAAAGPLIPPFKERAAAWERLNSGEAIAAFGGATCPFPERVTLTAEFDSSTLFALLKEED